MCPPIGTIIKTLAEFTLDPAFMADLVHKLVRLGDGVAFGITESL